MPSRRDEFFAGLLRGTLEQLGSLRDVVARSSEAGRVRLDLSLLRRERAKLLETIGAEVAAAVRAGRMKVPADVAEILERIEDLDQRIGDQTQRQTETEADAYHAAARAASRTVARADDARPRKSPSGAERGHARETPPNVSPDLEADAPPDSDPRPTPRKRK